MKRLLIVCGILGSAALAGASSTFARQNQPGLPTLAQVQVLNRDRADAIPIKVQNTGDSLPVIITGTPSVSFAQNSIVGTLSARQIWEYRRLVIATANDVTPSLNEAGLQGWEAINAVTAGTNTIWMLKRPK